MTQPGCLFCRIADGSEPAHVIVDDQHTMAFLDTRPVFVGHALVVPKAHVGTLLDLPAELMAPLLTTAQRVAAAMPLALGSTGTFVAMNNVISQSVAHLHVHVVPRRKGDGLRGFFWPRQRYAAGQAEQTCQLLRGALAQIGD